jgi:hypothetical protein
MGRVHKKVVADMHFVQDRFPDAFECGCVWKKDTVIFDPLGPDHLGCGWVKAAENIAGGHISDPSLVAENPILSGLYAPTQNVQKMDKSEV